MTALENAAKIIATYEGYTLARGQFAPSPCVSVCLMGSDSELCDGCFRTLDEIAAWSGMDDDGKRGVWQRLVQRASAALSDARLATNSPPEWTATRGPRA
jgi:uncharacterized protein